ncbi:MAG: peptidylprolyl isomerase [Candidatus Hydrogenedentes bacterium]|nr:peptidylprolyl isomerase [Candidatus Hydrogenedentota bacterium]
MLRKLSVAAAVVVGVVVLAAINKQFIPKIDPEGVKKQEEEEKRIKERQEILAKQSVDVSHILIKASGSEAVWKAAKEKIDAARKRVTEGEDFEKVAREVSEDPSVKDNGGAFPGTPRGKMVPEFEKVMFSTHVGDVSEPFRTKFGWHIVKVTGRHGGERSADDTVKLAAELGMDLTKVPDIFKVKFETTKGAFIIECHKDWAPLGVARFYELIQQKFYDDNRFFRVVKGFVVQWGISGDPAVNAKWVDKTIPDDPVRESNKLSTVCFAKGGPDSRTTQVFVNLKNNKSLDNDGFAVFGKVIEGMDVIASFNGEHAGNPSDAQSEIQLKGNAFLDSRYPGLDSIKSAQIIQ